MSVRARLIQGAGYLVARQLMGMLVSGIGSLVLARLIGPVHFGTYAASFAVIVYLYAVFHVGVGVYLVSRPGEMDRETLGHANALVLGLNVAGVLIASCVVLLLSRFVDLGPFRAVFFAMAPGLLLQGAGVVPAAVLERGLDYSRVASVEAANQIMQVVVAVAVAFVSPSVWAPVAGFWAAILASTAMLVLYVPQAFVLSWRFDAMIRLARASIPFAASNWIIQLRTLANPLLVGFVLGPAAVGVVALTVRLVTVAGFMQQIMQRIAISGLRRIAENRQRIARIIEPLAIVQSGLVGLPLIALSVAIPFLIQFGFGAAWAAVIPLYPVAAIAMLLNGLSSIPTAALIVLSRNRSIVLAAGFQTALIWMGAALLAPRIGLIGYGLAEVIGGLSILVSWRAAREALGDFPLVLTVANVTVFASVLSWPYLGYAAFAPLILAVIVFWRRKAQLAAISEIRRWAQL